MHSDMHSDQYKARRGPGMECGQPGQPFRRHLSTSAMTNKFEQITIYHEIKGVSPAGPPAAPAAPFTGDPAPDAVALAPAPAPTGPLAAAAAPAALIGDAAGRTGTVPGVANGTVMLGMGRATSPRNPKPLRRHGGMCTVMGVHGVAGEQRDAQGVGCAR